MTYLVLIAIGAAFAWFTARAAAAQGRDGAVWGVLGFFFGFVPLVILMVSGGGSNPRRVPVWCPSCKSDWVDETSGAFQCRKCNHLWEAAKAEVG